jgi:predicted small lipoprotein YifL
LGHSDRLFLRLALIGALAASLGLAACGRKGPLDPPPAASLAGEQPVTTGETPTDDRRILGPDGKPISASRNNKPFALDVLLN